MQYEKEHHAGDCRFQTVLLRKISDMEGKFASQMSKLQQQGELHLARAVALAKDAAMAEFSPIVKGVSEVLHSQLRRMDHLEAQWRLLEKRCEDRLDDVPRDLEGSFLAKKEWQYPVEDRSGWLPAGAQELADNHPWTRRAVEKNPRFPGYVPPEALFCWTEPDFASYINSGGFVKPKMRCQYYISPENPQTIVDLLEPILSEPQPNRLCEKCWWASQDSNMIDHHPTLKYRGLVNRLTGVNMFTKVGMLELIRERCNLAALASKSQGKWIYKPNAEAMGRGIILVGKISDVDSRERPFRTRCKNVEVFDPKEPPLKERDFAHYGVIQEYMVNPLLLENRKFAVRVFMLVARTNPLLVFHYNFGYIKRCGEFYDENKFNREDLFRHITNQEFQKKRDDFTMSAAAELMSIEDLDKYLQEHYGIPAFRLNFWQQVKSICMEVTLGMKEGIAERGKLGQFELFGLDVIVDADQREMGEPPAVTLEGEMLQISTRLADLEGRTGKQHELEISISSIAQKTELLEQDTGRQIQERSKCLKAWQEAKEEQNREFLERFERINVETQLKTLQLKLQEVLKSAQQQQEFAEVLEKRIESQEFEAAHRLERFDSRRSMRQELCWISLGVRMRRQLLDALCEVRALEVGLGRQAQLVGAIENLRVSDTLPDLAAELGDVPSSKDGT
eukprot:g28281.t1